MRGNNVGGFSNHFCERRNKTHHNLIKDRKNQAIKALSITNDNVYIKLAKDIPKHKQSKTYYNLKRVYSNFKYPKIKKLYNKAHHNLIRD